MSLAGSFAGMGLRAAVAAVTAWRARVILSCSAGMALFLAAGLMENDEALAGQDRQGVLQGRHRHALQSAHLPDRGEWVPGDERS
jgi:hypothetical protein